MFHDIDENGLQAMVVMETLEDAKESIENLAIENEWLEPDGDGLDFSDFDAYDLTPDSPIFINPYQT
tara:strand:- start:1215 stop:1415 length:201 start_codon:yes stop_codon:yes gene_type:complete